MGSLIIAERSTTEAGEARIIEFVQPKTDAPVVTQTQHMFAQIRPRC